MIEQWQGRGAPWEFDPGPPRNRRWGRLFATTPNYRELGRAVTGSEAFRWHFGPMFYRGRLGDGAVKVLVVGQEGAQDESLAARAFVGGTGARMQYLLHHLGITRSYLFLNTFVYPIFGQYTDKLRRLAQHPASPIVQHRHAIFDYLLSRNDLRLVIAVGTAARESVVTWVRSHGGVEGRVTSDLTRCDPTVLGPRVRLLSVLHPGGAVAGGAAAIVADFRRAIRQIEQWTQADPDWLPPDPGGTRLPADGYAYRSAPIPFRDLPYGMSWRLGRGATSSNRTDGQRGIQLFGGGGRYNGSGDTLTYTLPAPETDEGYDAADGDLPYEPPRRHWQQFDPGPPAAFARLLQGGVTGLAWPDFRSLGATGDGSFGLGGGYRGRFTGVRVLVLADDPSYDDLFCGRVLCGDAGQHLQGLLEAMGVQRDYLILGVLPVPTQDLGAATVRGMVDHPAVRALHAEVVRRVRARSDLLAVVLAVGPGARRLAAHLPFDAVPVIDLKAWHEPGARHDWQRGLDRVAELSDPPGTGATFAWDGRRRQIPREDLPYGLACWRGTSGERAIVPEQDGGPSLHYRKLLMPRWASQLAPTPLSGTEQTAAALLLD